MSRKGPDPCECTQDRGGRHSPGDGTLLGCFSHSRRSPVFYTFSTFLLQSPVLTFPPPESLLSPPPPYVSDSIHHSPPSPHVFPSHISIVTFFQLEVIVWSVSGTNTELFEGRQWVEHPRMTLTPSPGPALSEHSLTVHLID